MQLQIGAIHLEETLAGLAIHDDAIYFIELDEDSNPTKKIKIPLPEGCVVNEQVKNFTLLENAFRELYKEAGKIREPISVGLPAGDVIIKLLNFPKMDIEDLRGTMDLNFEEHFNFPRHDAVFDLMKVKTPADIHERDEVTVLAAAARRNTVEQILDSMWKAGLPAGGVEPVSFAMLRTVDEAQSGLCIFANSKNVIAVYEGMGVYFRSITHTANVVQDIQNTLQYVRTQYRGMNVDKIITAGLNLQIGENQSSSIQFINITDEFYSAEGVTLRGANGVQALDMRPMEFVELEKRRYHFNINRLILWSLLVIFVMLSIGTISFAFSCVQSLTYEMDVMRENVDEMTRQRMDIASENSKLEKQKDKIEKVLSFLRSDIPVLEIMRQFEVNAGKGLKFDRADFTRGVTGVVTINIDGKAEDEKTVLTMTEGLKRSTLFSNVFLPVSQRDTTGRMVFKLILTVGEIASENS